MRRSRGDAAAAARDARRRLLKLGTYLVPAILGTFTVTRTAEAQTCLPPQGCNPRDCGPFDCAPFDCDPFRACTPDCQPSG